MSAIVKPKPIKSKYLIGAELECLRLKQNTAPFQSAPKMYRLSSNLKGLFSYIKGDYTRVVYLPTGEIISSRLAASVFNGVVGKKKEIILSNLEKGMPFGIFSNGCLVGKCVNQLSPFKFQDEVIYSYYIKGVLFFKSTDEESVWNTTRLIVGTPDMAELVMAMISTY